VIGITSSTRFRPHNTNLQARQLLLSLLFLAVPTVFGIGEGIQPMAGNNALDRFGVYSLIVALLILGYDLLSSDGSLPAPEHPPVALGCTRITELAVHWITENNELDWYEGVQLVALYGVMGLGSLLL
jgi:Ca2+/H+ antiporter